jgi:enamine deaminase RidA (YjgF/YER057c/UK114 family)
MKRMMILFAALSATPAAAQQIERHPTTPPGPILGAVTVPPGATTLHISGQVPAAVTPGDFGDTKAQTLSVLGKIRAILAARGMTMADLVKLNVYLVGDPKLGGKMDFAGMNAGYREVFGTAENPNLVARTTVQISALANPAFLVEIDAVAARVGR